MLLQPTSGCRGGQLLPVGLTSCDFRQGLCPFFLRWRLAGAADQMLLLSTSLSCPGLSLTQGACVPHCGVEVLGAALRCRWAGPGGYVPQHPHAPGSTTLSCVHAAPRGPSGYEPQMRTAPCFVLFPSLPRFPHSQPKWFLGSLLRRTTCIQILDSGSVPGGPQNMTEAKSVHLVGL